MNGLFWFIAHSLELGSLDDLLGLVASFEETPRHFRFSAEELVFLKEYDMRAGLEPLADDHYSQFPPSRIIVLSNYLLLSRLFTEIGTAAQGVLTSVCRYTNLDGSSPPLGHPALEMGIIDSHFHMDRVMFNYGRFTARSGLKDVDVTPPVHLAYAIANYVYPSSWNSLGLHMRDDRLGFTLGLHPHMITKTNYMFYLHKIELLFQQYPQALGVGEIGYDLTSRCKHPNHHDKEKCKREQRLAQLQFLRQGILLAKRTEKVLILHVRDPGNGQAAPKVLDLLKELGMNNHLIHRHCFTGGEAEYRAWREDLPNCYFSISPKSIETPSTVALLRILEGTDRLILETDAPYLDEPNPWCVYHVAEEAARHLRMSKAELIRVCNKNAARLYNLPW